MLWEDFGGGTISVEEKSRLTVLSPDWGFGLDMVKKEGSKHWKTRTRYDHVLTRLAKPKEW